MNIGSDFLQCYRPYGLEILVTTRLGGIFMLTIHSPVKAYENMNSGRPYCESRTDSASLNYVHAETFESIGVSDQAKLHP